MICLAVWIYIVFYLLVANLRVFTEVDNSSAWELLHLHGLPCFAVPCDFWVLTLNEVGHDTEGKQNDTGESESPFCSPQLPRCKDGFNLKDHDMAILSINWSLDVFK